MYRVEIIDQAAGKGGFRTDANLVVALCGANHAASAITPKAMIVGVLAWAICHEHLSLGEETMARELINHVGIPENMRELVELADMP